MNNHWRTNYNVDQDDLTAFRHAPHPHDAYDSGAAARFGVEVGTS